MISSIGAPLQTLGAPNTPLWIVHSAIGPGHGVINHSTRCTSDCTVSLLHSVKDMKIVAAVFVIVALAIVKRVSSFKPEGNVV